MTKYFTLAILSLCFINTSYGRSEECYCFNSLKLKVDGFAGLNTLNGTTLEDGNFRNKFGAVAGIGIYFHNITKNKNIIPRADVFMNYSMIDNERFRQTILSYNISFLFGYRLNRNLEAYIGPNLISGLSSEQMIIPSLRTKLGFKVTGVHMDLGFLFIAKRYNINNTFQSYSQPAKISYITSITLSFPIFKKIYYKVRYW